MSVAVSNPSITGMLTSSRMTAKSCSQKTSQRLPSPKSPAPGSGSAPRARLVGRGACPRRSSTDQDVDLLCPRRLRGWNSLGMSNDAANFGARVQNVRYPPAWLCNRSRPASMHFSRSPLHRFGGQSDDRKCARSHTSNGWSAWSS